MIRNYLKISIRSITKNKFFALINVIGLALGITTGFFTIQYSSFELSYDRIFSNHDSIYRLLNIDNISKRGDARALDGLKNDVLASIPEVDNYVRLFKPPANTGKAIMVNGKAFNETNYIYAEKEFFKVFKSLLIRGDPNKVLKEKNSIVLSEKLAHSLFGDEDPIGKVIVDMEINEPQNVTGVFKSLPVNSHLNADLLIPLEFWFDPSQSNNWDRSAFYNYLTLTSGTDHKIVEEKINRIVFDQSRTFEKLKDTYIELQNVKDIHLSKGLTNELSQNGDKMIATVLIVMAIIILIISWINYVNMETGQLIGRIQEVGIRLSMGSSKLDIVLQFVTQFFVLNGIALGIAFASIFALSDYISSQINIPVELLLRPNNITLLFLTLYVCGTLGTAIVPVMALLKFSPVSALKGKIILRLNDINFSKSLLVFQFFSAICLMTFLVVIQYQISLMRSIPKNIKLDQVIFMPNPTNYTVLEDSLRYDRYQAFRQSLLEHPDITSVTSSSVIPGTPVGFTYVDLAKRNLNDPNQKIPYKVVYIDYDFFKTFGVNLAKGRNYEEENQTDKDWKSLIINESAVKALGFKTNEEAIGSDIYFQAVYDWSTYQIIGIVKDYRQESVKSPVYPSIYYLHQYQGQQAFYSVKVNSPTQQHIDYIKSIWANVWPEKPFEFHFLDSYYDQQFKAERASRKIFFIFTTIAIIISCLGIFGFTMQELKTRKKEISIRKVLGATTRQMIFLLSKSNFRLICLASIFAIPSVYLFSDNWLMQYPVKIALSASLFIGPLLLVFFIVFLTTSLQIFKVAMTNPADALKDE